MFVSVLGDDVVYDLLAAVVLEVHVYIRHLLALQVQEALEDEAIGHGVDVGDSQTVQHEARRRAAAHCEEYILLAHKAGNVPDYQEVVVEVRLLDDMQFVAQPLAVFLAGVRQEFSEAFPAYLGQVLERGEAVGNIVERQAQAAEVYVQVALIGDSLRVGDSVGQIVEERGHLLRTLEIVRRLLHAEPSAVFHVRVGVDADEYVLQAGVPLQYVVRVVGGDDGYAEVLVNRVQPVIDLGQFRHVAVPHEFQVVVSKDFPVPACGGAGVVHASLRDERRHFPTWAAGHDDQPIAELFQNLAIHAGLVVEAFQMRARDQLDQVLVAGIVLGEDGHVVRAALVGVSVVPTAGRDVHFASDDGLDALGLGELVEVYRAVHPAVIGNGEAVHAQLARSLNQRLEPAETVQHRVLGMRVKVGEHGKAPLGMFRVTVSGLYHRARVAPSHSIAVSGSLSESVGVDRAAAGYCAISSGATLKITLNGQQ